MSAARWHRIRGERGAAIVEAPLAIALFFLLAMGITTVVQLIWTHLQLSSSVRSTMRYAAHVDYDPEAGGIDRRRTEAQVEAWAVEVAQEAGVDADDVTIIGLHYPCGTGWSDSSASPTVTSLSMDLTAAQIILPTTSTTSTTTSTTSTTSSTTSTTLLPDPSTTATIELPATTTTTSSTTSTSTTTTTLVPLPTTVPTTAPSSGPCEAEPRPIDELVAGDQIEVTVDVVVSNPLYQLAASVTNIASHVVGAGDVFNPDGIGVSSGATTYVE
jgi:hypothetical protein